MHDVGYSMSERTIGRMLKKLGLRSRIARKYKHTTDSNHRLPTAPNLLDRQFTVISLTMFGKRILSISVPSKDGCIYV
jgi:putative transposase